MNDFYTKDRESFIVIVTVKKALNISNVLYFSMSYYFNPVKTFSSVQNKNDDDDDVYTNIRYTKIKLFNFSI